MKASKYALPLLPGSYGKIAQLAGEEIASMSRHGLLVGG